MILKNVVGLNREFLWRLEVASSECRVDFVVTSGFRTIGENRAVGGVSNSSHLRGLAVDLLASDSRSRFFIIKSLLALGFRRIGVSSDHVHVDDSRSLVQNVFFIE